MLQTDYHWSVQVARNKLFASPVSNEQRQPKHSTAQVKYLIRFRKAQSGPEKCSEFENMFAYSRSRLEAVDWARTWLLLRLSCSKRRSEHGSNGKRGTFRAFDIFTRIADLPSSSSNFFDKLPKESARVLTTPLWYSGSATVPESIGIDMFECSGDPVYRVTRTNY